MALRAFMRVTNFGPGSSGPPVTQPQVNVIAVILDQDNTPAGGYGGFGNASVWSADLFYSDFDGNFVTNIRSRIEDQVRSNIAALITSPLADGTPASCAAATAEFIWLDSVVS